MKILIKFIVILISIPLICGYGFTIFEVSQKVIGRFRDHLPFLIGVGVGIISFPFFLKRVFWRTFEHEMTHLIFAKLFFGKIKKFNVTDEGSGFVEYSSNPNPFISLSPYFFPLFSASLSVLIPLLNPALLKYLFLPVGFFLAQHLLFSIKEILSSQADIKEEGPIFSVFFVALFLIFFYGIIISSVISINQIIPFIKNGMIRSCSYSRELIALIADILKKR